MSKIFTDIGYIEPYYYKKLLERGHFWSEPFESTTSPSQRSFLNCTIFDENDGIYVKEDFKKIKITIEFLDL